MWLKWNDSFKSWFKLKLNFEVSRQKIPICKLFGMIYCRWGIFNTKYGDKILNFSIFRSHPFATTLSRQRYPVFRPKNGWLLPNVLFGVATPFRNLDLKLFIFFLACYALFIRCRIVDDAKLNNCCMPSSAHFLY